MITYPPEVTAPGPLPQPLGVGLPGGSWPPVPAAATPTAEDVVRQQAAALLLHTYRWLRVAAPVAPQVLGLVPMLLALVQLYQAQDYLAARDHVAAAMDTLRQAGSAAPALPPL